ncbi:hypothetical protein EV363DRAFT_268952 [Boletus edulis]|nr:hypothetical protein EV363DRAFT_268952 [Boletus edulis]
MDDERFPSQVAPNERLSQINEEDKRATGGFGGSLRAQRKRETWLSVLPRRGWLIVCVDNQSTRRKGVALPQEIHVGNKVRPTVEHAFDSKGVACCWTLLVFDYPFWWATSGSLYYISALLTPNKPGKRLFVFVRCIAFFSFASSSRIHFSLTDSN